MEKALRNERVDRAIRTIVEYLENNQKEMELNDLLPVLALYGLKKNACIYVTFEALYALADLLKNTNEPA